MKDSHVWVEVKPVEVTLYGVTRAAHLMVCDRCYQVEWHCHWVEFDMIHVVRNVCTSSREPCEAGW